MHPTDWRNVMLIDPYEDYQAEYFEPRHEPSLDDRMKEIREREDEGSMGEGYDYRNQRYVDTDVFG